MCLIYLFFLLSPCVFSVLSFCISVCFYVCFVYPLCLLSVALVSVLCSTFCLFVSLFDQLQIFSMFNFCIFDFLCLLIVAKVIALFLLMCELPVVYKHTINLLKGKIFFQCCRFYRCFHFSAS